MRDTVFVRLHAAVPEEKGAELASKIFEQRNGYEVEAVFVTSVPDLGVVPGSPFAYWIPKEVAKLFHAFPSFCTSCDPSIGLSTKDDVRYLRAHWEVDSRSIGYSREDSFRGMRWVNFAKGGEYSPFFAELALVVDWWHDGTIMKTDIVEYRGSRGWGYHWSAAINGHGSYFRTGLTWSRRTTRDLSVRPLPSGSIFGEKGPSLFVDGDDIVKLKCIQIVLQSSIAREMLQAMLAAATAAARSYEVGLIQQLPFPLHKSCGSLDTLFDEAMLLQRQRYVQDETTHSFSLQLTSHPDTHTASLLELASSSLDGLSACERELVALQVRIDESAFNLYELPDSERVRLRMGPHGASSFNTAELAIDDSDDDADPGTSAQAFSAQAANLLMWCVGVAFGRWDVRMARDQTLIPALQGPFERLPRVAPGGLVGPDELPATADRIASEAWLRARPDVITPPEPGSWEGPDHVTAAEYPLEVAWDGVLVDDEGHPRDIVARVQAVLAYVHGERAEAIEEEALSILRGEGKAPRTLREWFRTQKAAALGKSFFDFHIQRYSKSRRKAPIYWRLASSARGGEYAVWLYYPRLSDDTLWNVLNDYVVPKQRLEERRVQELRMEREGATGAEVRRLEKEIEIKVQLVEELQWMERELRTVAERGYAPELDDGVLISAAPLHRVIAWKEPEAAWKKLERGEYDWAKLAMKLWPERVREKCATDRSLAIAHGIEGTGQGS